MIDITHTAEKKRPPKRRHRYPYGPTRARKWQKNIKEEDLLPPHFLFFFLSLSLTSMFVSGDMYTFMETKSSAILHQLCWYLRPLKQAPIGYRLSLSLSYSLFYFKKKKKKQNLQSGRSHIIYRSKEERSWYVCVSGDSRKNNKKKTARTIFFFRFWLRYPSKTQWRTSISFFSGSSLCVFARLKYSETE